MHQEELIDFAIITAVEVERKAVCKVLGLTHDNRVRKGSRVYWKGSIPLKADLSASYTIVVAQSSDMANVDSALLTSTMLIDWEPNAIILAGIAGAAGDDAKLGDVVVGYEVYYYERGKMTPDGLKPEPKMFTADATLWSNITAIPKWTSRIMAVRPDAKKGVRPSVHYGVIACGEKVIADEAARNQIAEKHRKILAIEMEGYGFSKAVWQDFNHPKHIVVKSICDNADRNKNEDWQEYAAAASASFIKNFLQDKPLVPRAISQKNAAEKKSVITSIEFTLDKPMEKFDENDFKNALEEIFGINIRNVRITSIRAGSVIVVLQGEFDELAKIIDQLRKSSYIRRAFQEKTDYVSLSYHGYVRESSRTRTKKNHLRNRSIEHRRPIIGEFIDTQRVRGTLKWYQASKGFGFIAREGGPDVFVHFSLVQDVDFSKLEENQIVEFEIKKSERGLTVTEVTLNPEGRDKK